MLTMKTHIDIDAKLLADAMQFGNHPTKRDAVNAALQEYVSRHARQAILDLAGKVTWVGDLDEMRGRKHRVAKPRSRRKAKS